MCLKTLFLAVCYVVVVYKSCCALVECSSKSGCAVFFFLAVFVSECGFCLIAVEVYQNVQALFLLCVFLAIVMLSVVVDFLFVNKKLLKF